MEAVGTIPVSEAQRELTFVQNRLAEVQAERAQLRSAIPVLSTNYQRAVIAGTSDADKHRQALDAAKARLEELFEVAEILAAAVREGENVLASATQARQERERLHWQQVASGLAPGVEKWAAKVMGFARPGVAVLWPPEWGTKPLPEQRVAAAQSLRERYPFVDPLEPAAKGKR